MTDMDLMYKQMLEFNRTIADNSLKVMATFQDQSIKMMDNFLDRNSWLPEEGKQLTKEWFETCKKSAADFQKTTDEYFKMARSCFEPPSDLPKANPMNSLRSEARATAPKKASSKSSSEQPNKK